MPKFFELPDDFDVNSLGEAKAVLKPYQPEDVTGIKNKANELLGEKKAIEARAAELEAQLKKSKVQDPDGKNSEKIQAQLEDAMNRLKEQQEAYAGLQKEVKQSKINGEASRLAALLTKDARRAALLAEKISGRIDIDNGKPVVLDHGGNPTISTLDDLAETIKKEFDFLVDGSQATGGGATGGSGGAAKSKEMKRSDFDKLSQFERATFARSGGKVIND
jgi:hypothetical protein